METVIDIKDLKKYFFKHGKLFSSSKDAVKAVDGITFSVKKGQTFGLVGESGCGKSTVAKLIVGILKPDSGKIFVNGDSDIVFQDPYSSLNPRMSIRQIIGESLFVRGEKKDKILTEVRKMLELVRLSEKGCENKYPHQFSGGERQRIAIARALIRRPEIIILDEPVSSLDVSIQAGILNLLKDLQRDLDITYLFISHDLRIVEFMSDIVGVMKDGKIVEMDTSDNIFSSPKDEYTRHLLNSIPKIML